MRVLLLQDQPVTSQAGESLFRRELALLRASGLDVFAEPMRQGGAARVREICRSMRPDVAHVVGLSLPLTAEILTACGDADVPVLQSLPNLEGVCASRGLWRHGAGECRLCASGSVWPAALHGCAAHGGRTAIPVVRAMREARAAWSAGAGAALYTAATPSIAETYLGVGVPRGRLRVLPPSAPDPDEGMAPAEACNEFLAIAGLDERGGAGAVLAAWAARTQRQSDTLIVAGGGADSLALRQQARRLGLTADQVSFTGPLSIDALRARIRTARAVVFPSSASNGWPVLAVEAMAHGRPLIASRVLPMEDLVTDGRNGYLYRADDAAALAEAMDLLSSRDELAARMARESRADYSREYTSECEYGQLLRLYGEAMELHRRNVPQPVHSKLLTVRG